jgi:hypothetical protein
MASDTTFSGEFTYKNNDPWEKDIKRRRGLQQRGAKSKVPGAGRRKLLGLPEDYQPDGKGLDESLNERNERNKWERESFDQAMDAEEHEDADEEDDKGNPLDGERMMWRLLAGPKPSDKRLKPQSWIDEQRKKRRSGA